MSGRFGEKKYAPIIAELEVSGFDLSSLNDVRMLYVMLARAKGIDMPESFLPRQKQVRHALGIYRQKGVLANLAKTVTLARSEDGYSSEDVMALAAQNRREGNITRLFLSQQGKCHYCDRDMSLNFKDREKANYATIDHIVPKCEGGTRAEGNVVGACMDCNSRKGHMAYHLFMTLKGKVA